MVVVGVLVGPSIYYLQIGTMVVVDVAVDVMDVRAIVFFHETKFEKHSSVSRADSTAVAVAFRPEGVRELIIFFDVVVKVETGEHAPDHDFVVIGERARPLEESGVRGGARGLLDFGQADGDVVFEELGLGHGVFIFYFY